MSVVVSPGHFLWWVQLQARLAITGRSDCATGRRLSERRERWGTVNICDGGLLVTEYFGKSVINGRNLVFAFPFVFTSRPCTVHLHPFPSPS